MYWINKMESNKDYSPFVYIAPQVIDDPKICEKCNKTMGNQFAISMISYLNQSHDVISKIICSECTDQYIDIKQKYYEQHRITDENIWNEFWELSGKQ